MTPAPDARRQFVLVIDSNCFRGRGLAEALNRVGCYTAFVPTGDAAIRYVIEHEPDAVIADWELPDMEGLEFAREVTLGGFRTRVILQKESADWRSLRSTLESGAEDLLSRPCAADVVLRVLERPQARTGNLRRSLVEAAG